MKPLIATIRELFSLTHAAGVHLCVWSCERDVQRAKQRLADALAAQDRVQAQQRINDYTEPAAIPASLRRQA